MASNMDNIFALPVFQTEKEPKNSSCIITYHLLSSEKMRSPYGVI